MLKVASILCFSLVYLVSFAQSDHLAADTLRKDTVALESVSVFGYSQTQQVNRQAYHVTAVDAKKLRNTTLDIAHVLDRVPGARLRETGGVGSDYEFSLNGFSGKRVRFFLDGVPMDQFGSAFQINNIPINLAERVEVYKGVVPVWLGSDALGGAVNIITDNGRKNYLDVSYAYGSFNTHRANINAAATSANGLTFQLNVFQNYSDNDYRVTVDAADIRTGKYYPNTQARRFHDQYHNETAIVRVGVVGKAWADQLLAGITLGQYYKEIQTGARLNAVYGAWHARGNIVMPTLKYQKKGLLANRLDLVVNAHYNLGKEQSIDTVHARYNWLGDSVTYRGKGGELWYSHYLFRNHAANASATATYRIDDRQFLALNNVYSHFNRRGINAVSPHSMLDNIPQKTDKNILGFSYQYEIDGVWSATAFAKYIHQSAHTTLIETDVLNPRDTVYNRASKQRDEPGYGLATSYYLTPQLQLKASYEKASRMPESEDLYGDVMNREGNWDIKPETSDNLNFGLNYTMPLGHHRIYLSTTGSYYRAKDFIYYTVNGYTNRLVAGNLFTVSNTGIESEVRYSYKQRVSVGAHITYQDIRDKERYRKDLPTPVPLESNTYNERIPNIPYLFGNADASLYLPNLFNQGDQLNLSYNLLYVNDFYLYWKNEGATDTKRVVPTQLAHDATVVYAFKGGRYNVALECKNLTDRKLYDNFSLQKPGRSFTVKIRYFISQ